MLSVPIILFTVNKLIGVLTLQEKVVREFTEDEIAFTETVSGQIAIAIENARLYEMTDEKLREKVTQLSTLRHVTASLVSTVDRSEALDMIVQHAMTLTGRRYVLDLRAGYGLPRVEDRRPSGTE